MIYSLNRVQNSKNQSIMMLYRINLDMNNHAIIFLRYSSLAFRISPLVSIFLVARTLIFSAPLDFLIFLFNYFSDFLFGFLLGRIAALLNL